MESGDRKGMAHGGYAHIIKAKLQFHFVGLPLVSGLPKHLGMFIVRPTLGPKVALNRLKLP